MVQETDDSVSEAQSTSSERNFAEELWQDCNECCDVQQFFCCLTFILFVLGVFAAIVTILIFFKPFDVDVKIHSVTVNNYTVIKRIEENNQGYFAVYVVAYINFVLLATNPSEKYTVIYSNMSLECSTRNLSLGMLTTSPFRQAPHTSTNWTKILLLDVPEPVPSSLRVPIIQDAMVNDVVILNIGGAIAAHFEIGGVYFPTLEDTLNCTVKFKYIDQSNVNITC